MDYPNEEEELKNRFYRQLLEDLSNDDIKPYPTYIMEMEDPEFLELIRPFVMFGNMKPYDMRVLIMELPTREELERKKIKSYGNLYVLVNPN
jgi:hypothetical protein